MSLLKIWNNELETIYDIIYLLEVSICLQEAETYCMKVYVIIYDVK